MILRRAQSDVTELN